MATRTVANRNRYKSANLRRVIKFQGHKGKQLLSELPDPGGPTHPRKVNRKSQNNYILSAPGSK